MWIFQPHFSPWLIILGGLLIGTLARWAVMQSLDQKVDGRQVRIDAMMLLMNGLLAAQFAETFSITGVKLGVASAMFGASSTMIFSKAHEAFVARATRTDIFMAPNSTASVPHEAPDVEVHAIGAGSPQTETEVLIEAIKNQPLEPSDEQIEEIIRRLREIE